MTALVKKPRRQTQEANAALMDLAEAHGGVLKPEVVIAAARDENSPLHKYFEWDDQKAAEQARNWQARALIQHVTVNIAPNKNAQKVTRAFVSLSLDRSNGGGYRVTADVLSNDMLRQQMIEDSLEQMAKFRSRFSSLQELGSVFTEMRVAEYKLLKKKPDDRETFKVVV